MIDPLINARHPCPVFRGRTEELSALQQQAGSLPAGIFAITGSPGAGKTSLLDEFLVGLQLIGSTGAPHQPNSPRPREVHPITHIRLETSLLADPIDVAKVV